MKSIFTIVTVLVLAGLALIVPAESNANLIINGGFDNGYSSWTPANNDGAGGWRGTGGNPGGRFILNAAGQTTLDPTIAQTITGLQTGQTYSVTWDQFYEYQNTPGPIGFGVYLDSQPGNPISLNGYTGTGWKTFSTTFVASAPVVTLIFAAELDGRTPGVSGSTDMGYAIDNVKMEASSVPLPSALLFFGPGLAGLAAIRRRFKK